MIDSKGWAAIVSGVALVALLIKVYFMGAANVQAKWDAQRLADYTRAEKAKAVLEGKQQEIVANLEEKLRISEERKNEVTEIEVIKYVTKEDDNTCRVPNGFISLYNGSIMPSTARLPPSPTNVVTGASTVKISTVARIASQNNAECVARGEALKAWQEWYHKSKNNFDNAKKLK